MQTTLVQNAFQMTEAQLGQVWFALDKFLAVGNASKGAGRRLLGVTLLDVLGTHRIAALAERSPPPP